MAHARILVTGGTGFIGRQLVQGLTAEGRDVHIVSSRPDAEIADGAAMHTANLLDPIECARVVAEVDADELIHLAWFVQPGQVWNSVENTRWVEASLGLLREFAHSGGMRVVMAGTCSEYGPESGLCHEDRTPLEPSNLYGTCKNSLREVALASAGEMGLSIAWARIFMAYGPHEHPVRLVASVIGHLLRSEPAPTSHGHQVRDFLSTPEISAALTAVLDSGIEGPVNVASGQPHTLRELVECIAQSIGRPELIRYGDVTPPADDPPFQVGDVRRLNAEVGWQPTEDMKVGIERTIDWWRGEFARPGG